jgi:hypothetical protein
MGKHLRLHLAAYGDVHIRPKHHWLLDVPAQFRRDGLVLDAFIIERIHLRIKAPAEKIRKTVSFERSVLSSTLAAHLNLLETAMPHGGLLGRTAPMPGMLGAVVADRMEVAGVEFSVGDVLLLGEHSGMLAACCLEGGCLIAIVRELAKKRDVTSTASDYTFTDSLAVWLAVSCVPATAWRHRTDGSILVVRR